LLALQPSGGGVIHAEGARLLGLTAALDLARSGVAVVGFDDPLTQRAAAHQGNDSITPQAGPPVDDCEVLQGLQGLESQLGTPLHGDQAIARLALEVLGHHVAVG